MVKKQFLNWLSILAAVALLTGCGGGGGNDNVRAPLPLAVQYFSASDGISGPALWKTDGTAVGTVLVKDIHTSGSSNPYGLTVFNNALYFAANEGTNSSEL